MDTKQIPPEVQHWLDRQVGGFTKDAKAVRARLMNKGQRYWWAIALAVPVVTAAAFALGRFG